MYLLSTIGWVLSTAVVAMAVGGFALAAPRLMRISRTARLSVAIAMVPQIIAGWTILLTAVVPGVPGVVLAFGPGLIALPYLWFVVPRIWRWVIVAGWRNLLKGSRHRIVAAIAYAVLFVGIVQPVVYRFSQPIGGADIAQYLNEAKPLAKTRDFSDFVGFRGLDDGSLRGDFHGASWPAYLANALSANAVATGTVGPRQDLAVRIAIPFAFLTLFLAIISIALNLGQPWVTPIVAVSIFLTTSSLDYVLVWASRDAFRLTPMLCMIALLIGQLRGPGFRRHPLSTGILFAGVAAATVNAHTLALSELPLVMLAWLMAWMGRLRRNWVSICLVLSAVAIGTSIGGSHYIAAFVATGSPTGVNAIAEQALVGTIYESGLQLVHRPRVGSDASPLALVAHILNRDLIQLCTSILLSLLFVVVMLTSKILGYRWIGGDKNVMLFLSLLVLGVAFLFLAVGQFVGITFAAAANFRYVYLWNALSSTVLSGWVVQGILFDWRVILEKSEKRQSW